MSWQDYVDNQLIASQCVSKACIAGHDGGVWAKSEAFEVSLLLMMQHGEKKCLEIQKFLFFFIAFVGRYFMESLSAASRLRVVNE